MRQQLAAHIREYGFESVGEFSASSLTVFPEVRDMCAQNKCNAYNKSWSCPPHCGSLQHFEELFRHYKNGFAFQTVGKMSDPFDYETISTTSDCHLKRIHGLADSMYAFRDSILLLSSGSCTLCPSCSCPDSPCRHPEKMSPSMEAAGLMVNDVCLAASIPYNHGKNTIAFISCILF
jgi:predicted metal-binding protein